MVIPSTGFATATPRSLEEKVGLTLTPPTTRMMLGPDADLPGVGACRSAVMSTSESLELGEVTMSADPNLRPRRPRPGTGRSSCRNRAKEASVLAAANVKFESTGFGRRYPVSRA